MDFQRVRGIENEAERVSALYEVFNEDSRLSHSQAARVEFITTVRYIEKYLKCGDKILDIGAGAGEYSLYFAQKGHAVAAVELAGSNIRAFEKKLRPGLDIALMQGDARDLSRFGDGAFDIVLLLGPLYHLGDEADRRACIGGALRVCKPGGLLFFAFISNDMVILTELCRYNQNFFKGTDYDPETFKLENFPFVFCTVDEARQLLRGSGVALLHEVASDGVSELVADKINGLDAESYRQYLEYHLYCCEKPEMLGRSNHLLFVGRKLPAGLQGRARRVKTPPDGGEEGSRTP